MHLFEPLALTSKLRLPNRIVMAPMTRCMAGQAGVPTAAMAAYYERRGEAGLIVAEATVVSQEATGYPNVPGLFSAEQVRGWQGVTEAVHAVGGRIFAQLWHTGRAAHSFYSDQQPLAPSAIALVGTLPRMRRLTYELPRPMDAADFARVTRDFASAAHNARAAGFDGIELHGANGYLLDQFLHHQSNVRDDEWGGSPENMARFPLQVVDALLEVLAGFPLGVRVSPAAHTNMQGDPRDRAVFDHYLGALAERGLAYVHLGAFDDRTADPFLGQRPGAYLRAAYPGTLIGAGSYSPEAAEAALVAGEFELCAFGRSFLANPDLVARVREGRPLEPYDPGLLLRLV